MDFFSNNEYSGIFLSLSSNNTLSGNNASNNNEYSGIYLEHSSNNTLSSNNASNNNGGIFLVSSSYNTLRWNNASNNEYSGIFLWLSSNNTLSGNNASNNKYGIDLTSSSNNILYLNEFKNNINAYSSNSINIWNSLEEIAYDFNGRSFLRYLGNYWSDYDGNDTNGDGIGDTPYYTYYVIPGNYLFSWDDIPGNDNELKQFLFPYTCNDYYYCWAFDANAEKIDDGMTIVLSDGSYFLYLKLNDEKTKVNLQDEYYTIGEFTAREEDGKLNIYMNDEIRGIVDYYPLLLLTNPPKEGKEGLLWETTIPVNIPPEGLNVPVNVNISSDLNKTTGRLVLKAVLYSNSSQVLSSSNYTFYVFDTNTTISLETDKEVYRPGESTVISGKIKNWADAPTSNLTFLLDADGNDLLSETFVLDAGETRTFGAVHSSDTSFDINAGIGDIKISQPVEVEAPILEVNVTSPEIAGRREFIVATLLENPGKLVINETLDVEGNIYNVSIHGGESKLIETPFIIDRNTTINITLLGDVDLTLSRFVIFGENASLKVSPETIYPPGLFEVPYTIENTGILETEFNANFSLEDKIIEKAFYLPVGGNFSGSLTFNLSEGDYILNYTTPFETGNVGVRVARMDIAGMNVTIPDTAVGNSLTVVVNVSNLGANNFTGNIEIDTGFYSNNSLLDLNISEKRSLIFKVPTLVSGVFNASVRLLHNGNLLEEKSIDFRVIGPEFTITSAPTDLNYRFGENVNMSFGVLNTGGLEGTAGLNLTIPGIYESINNSWISPGEEKNLSFNFILPDDLEEKSYKFLYGFNGDMQEGSFFVKGANISVEAALDKPFYNEGDTADLTLFVQNNRDFDLPLFSRVKFNEYDNITYFNLSGSGSETLSFNVPVHFTGDKIFYSVYMASGRSLYINSMYAYEKPEDDSGITLYTDKQVYLTGENVNVFVNVTGDGTLNMTAPGFTDTRSLTAGDSTVISFALPELKSGTYYIDYTFENFSSSYPFDVNGYSAKILEFTLDKELYDIGDTMNMKMLIEANRDFSGTVKMWVYGKSEEDSFELTRDFVKGENRIELNRTLNTEWSGIHSIVYGVYADIPGNSLVLLASGAEYFDVVDHVPPLITITSPQNIEYTTSSVPLIFTIKDTSGIEWIGYSLDGNENITISSSTILTGLVNGNHTIAVSARDSAGNTGSASVDFTVNATSIDTTPPVITSISASIAIDSAVITWNSDEASDSIVRYSTSSGSYTSSASNSQMVTSHTINLTGLTSDTLYYYIPDYRLFQ